MKKEAKVQHVKQTKQATRKCKQININKAKQQ